MQYAITSFLFSLLTILILRPLAVNVGLVDRPCERKVHSGNIPLVGGIAIFIGLLASLTILLESSKVINLFAISCGLMAFIGALDDFYDISAKSRLVAQVLIASILVFGTDYQMHSLGNLFGTGEVFLGIFSGPLALIAVVAAINAFNMTDGIDGLVGILSVITLSAVAYLLYISNVMTWFYVGIFLIASLAAFLLFNLGGLRSVFGKIFMGDAGSMMLGLSIVWLVLIGSQNVEGTLSFRPVTALWLIGLPLIDMVAVMHRRIRKRQSPLIADRDHLHHIFMRMGLSPKIALIVMGGGQALFAVTAVLGEIYQISELYMLIGYLSLFALFDVVFLHIWKFTAWVRRG
jgi:UDP-GlcNAc:undecaprenyl-phosphate/decaprenyl-phosphate GlcNAc-1-phosphate transferase